MSGPPEILLAALDHGPLPVAAAMNPKIETDSVLLRAVLDIHWDVPDPVGVLRRIEASLLSLSPGFTHHQCRGPAAYHVFAAADPHAATVSNRPAGPRPFDACLALAHLIEHAVIEFQCGITGARRCSGITGARRQPAGRFDLMVECADFPVGRFCLGFAIAALAGAANAHPPGPVDRAALVAARLARQRPERSWSPEALGRQQGWPAARAARALHVLADFGLLIEQSHALNFSGFPVYRFVSS